VSTLETVSQAAAAASLDFIVCGGFAVNAYQVMRKTGDIDLVVRERESKTWKDRLAAIGYSVFHESGAFVQLRTDSPSSWPIDLILVEDETFDGMKAAAKSFLFGTADCLIPSVEHLIAMKLHAIRSSGDSRLRQDALDIIDLADVARVDLEGETFRELCDRYADAKIRDRILEYAGKSST
jgi:hypothetical protein